MQTERSPLLDDRAPEPEALVAPNTKSSNASSRVIAFDLTRGLICLLMAIDHTFFISGKEHPKESYDVHPDRHLPYLRSWYHYGLRFVTHTCAPGFCILMGLGIVYFVESRVVKSGWTLRKTAKFITLRGLLFMAIGYISILPFRKQFHVEAFIIVDIIMTLGINFIIVGLLVLACRSVETPKSSTLITAVFGVVSVASACLTIFLSRFETSAIVQLLWLSGGTSTSFFVSRFPPLSWMPLVLYGVFYGRLTRDFPARRTAALSLLLCITFFLLFLAVRIPGTWGNLTPVRSSWYRKGVKEFFWTNKYCPDLAFITLFTSIDHFFITVFALLPKDFPSLPITGTDKKLNTNQVLLDIGTSPFAFYFAHFYSLLLIGTFLQAVGWVWTQEELGPGYTTAGLGNGWAFWSVYALLVAWMWLLCRSYGRFKSQKAPESAWRFF